MLGKEEIREIRKLPLDEAINLTLSMFAQHPSDRAREFLIDRYNLNLDGIEARCTDKREILFLNYEGNATILFFGQNYYCLILEGGTQPNLRSYDALRGVYVKGEHGFRHPLQETELEQKDLNCYKKIKAFIINGMNPLSVGIDTIKEDKKYGYHIKIVGKTDEDDESIFLPRSYKDITSRDYVNFVNAFERIEGHIRRTDYSEEVKHKFLLFVASHCRKALEGK